MTPELLDKVLSCKKLPSLPAIALKVIELTQDERVPVKMIGDTIANDQALSLKVLKTVNSSFYGLRKPCSSINQAIVMLGLSAVKTLALGFSLVSSLAKDKAAGFDYDVYWRRALTTGVAAKIIAGEARCGSDEEAFLGGLLQDVGMVALYQALGEEYAKLLVEAGTDHRRVARLEMQRYEASHADLGAMLATNWKLPAALIAPIKFHERPTAAPLEHATVCNVVALGNICADLLTAAEPAIVLKRLYEKGQELMNLSPGQIDAIVRSVNVGSREVATLLALPPGEKQNVEELLGRSKAALVSMAMPFNPGSELPTIEPHEADADSGLPSELVFKRNLIVAFEQAREGRSVSLAMLAIEDLAGIGARHGEATVSAVVRGAADRIRGPIEEAGGMVFRCGGDRFGAVLPTMNRAEATRCVDQARRAAAETALRIELPGLVPFELSIGVSAGVVCVDDSTRSMFTEAGDLLAMTNAAVAAAARAGVAGGALRVHAVKKAA